MTGEPFLKGKWALITGATSGLGFAVAEKLAEAGANVILHDVLEPKRASNDLRARFGVETLSVAADLRLPNAIAHWHPRLQTYSNETEVSPIYSREHGRF